MGCASSSFLEDDKEGALGAAAGGGGGGGHHIVSLTSTTYGLLTTLDSTPPTSTPPRPPPPPPPPPRPRSQPEVINSWELMEGLDLASPTATTVTTVEGGDANGSSFSFPLLDPLATFEPRCPPGGEECVVLYTTTLRGVRKTYEECSAVRAALEWLGVWVKERDVSMDMGFREELRGLMEGSADGCSVPKVFVRGRYVGGAEEVLRLQEEGRLAKMVEGLPRRASGAGAEACDGCGGSRFLPCFRCCGSRKVVVGGGGGGEKGRRRRGGVVVRCPECNENGLVLCPICC